MQELRFVAVSEDGSYAVLAVPGRSGRYILPIDERLRAVALGQTSRLAQYEIEVESPLRPKEIQARIRAGETAEEIADAAGIPVERVRWFEGPVLAERAYIAEQAQAGSVRRAGDSSGPGPRLGDIVTARLTAAGTDPADGQWDSRKRGDGSWQVSLTFPSGGRLHVAEWVFDPRRRHVMPDDDNAARLSLPESELPPEPVSVPGEATVTAIASRLGAAAGMGGGAFAAGPAVSRFRPERSVLPDRSLGADRSLADRPAAQTAPAAPAASAAPAGPAQDRHAQAERPAPPAAPSSSRHAQQDRPGYPDRRTSPGYAEFPESAPYRAPESSPAGTGRGYDDPAPGPSPAAHRAQGPEPGYREPAAEPPAYQEPAAYDDPVSRHSAEPASAGGAPGAVPHASSGPALDDPERRQSAASRQVIFEEPGPAPLGEQLEFAPAAAAAVTAEPGSAGPTAARSASGQVTEPAATAAPRPEAAPGFVPAAPVPIASEANVAARSAAPERPAAQTPAPAGPEVPGAAAAAPVPPAPAATPPAPRVPSAPAAAAAEPSVPAAAAAEPKAGVPVPAGPTAPEEAPTRPRPGAKKPAKGRRSSVPSWDEIMLGSSRQRD